MRRALSIVVLCLLVVGCNAGAGPKVAPGDAAHPFTLTHLDGRSVSLSDYAGRPVVLRFWSDWCAFCTEEMADIQTVFDAHKEEGLVVLAVNVGQERERAADFMTSLGLTYDCLLDTESEVASLYGVTGLPTTFFIGRDGVVRERAIGETKAAAFAANVRSLL